MGLINLNKKGSQVNSSVMYDKMWDRQRISNWFTKDHHLSSKFFNIDESGLVWFDSGVIFDDEVNSIFIRAAIWLSNIPPYVKLANIPTCAYYERDAEFNSDYDYDNGKTYPTRCDPDKMTNVVIPDTIKVIDNNAFYGCETMRHLTISDSVEEIGTGAFCVCINLEDVVISNSVTEINGWTFSGCRSLKRITIPKSVTSIDSATAFMGCDSLEDIYTEEDNVENLRELFKNSNRSMGFFDMIKPLPSNMSESLINLNKKGSQINSSMLYDKMREKQHIEEWLVDEKHIDKKYFNIDKDKFIWFDDIALQKDGIHSLFSEHNIMFNELPKYPTIKFVNIPEYAYSNCNDERIKEVVIPDSVEIIGKYAFSNCLAMKSVFIPNSVVSIQGCAFSGCCNLKSITIPKSVNEIKYNAFKDCYFIKSNLINNSRVYSFDHWGAGMCDEETSDGLLISLHTVVKCRPDAVSVIIPNSVNTIGKYAFDKCNKLTSITIPSSVTKIDYYAFSNSYYIYNNHIKNIKHIYTDKDNIGNLKHMLDIIDCEFLSKCIKDVAERDKVDEGLINLNKKGSQINSSTLYDKMRERHLIEKWLVDEKHIDKKYFNIDNDGVIWFNDDELKEDDIHGLFIMNNIMLDDLPKCPNIRFGNIPYYAYFNNYFFDVTIPDSVISIGEGAFSSSNRIVNITIPNSVTSIGNYAFSYSNLTNITISDSVTSIGDGAFYYCSNMTSVTIPDSVTSIGDYAFYHCFSLTSIIIPNSVTSIGAQAFYECSNLKSVTIPDSVTNILYGTFYDCYFAKDNFINNSSCRSSSNWAATICDIEQSDGLLITGKTVVRCRPYATSVTIPNSVTDIDSNAFYSCSKLKSVTIPSSVTKIGYGVFKHCLLKSIYTDKDNVERLKKYMNNNKLKKYVKYVKCIDEKPMNEGLINLNKIGSQINSSTLYDKMRERHLIEKWLVDEKHIDKKYFKIDNDGVIWFDETKLAEDMTQSLFTERNIMLDDLPKYPNIRFGNIPYHAYSNDNDLIDLDIPDSVTDIGYSAFFYCEHLTNVTIGNSVASIGDGAFYNCSSLRNVTISDSVTSIGNGAFSYCTSLSSVTIPDSVTDIGYTAFYDCYFTKDNFINKSSCTNQFNWGATLCDYETDEGLLVTGTTIVKCRPNATSVRIPSSITNIEKDAFIKCERLTSIFVPSSVTKIKYGVFHYCPSLETIYTDDVERLKYHMNINKSRKYLKYVKSIDDKPINEGFINLNKKGSQINSSVLYDRMKRMNTRQHILRAMDKYNMPREYYDIDDFGLIWFNNEKMHERLESELFTRYGIDLNNLEPCLRFGNIPDGAYMNSSELKHVVIPDSVKVIGDNAFNYCYHLESVVIPDSVREIKKLAFVACMNLKSITIPSSVVNIEYHAFNTCYIAKYNFINNSQCKNLKDWGPKFCDAEQSDGILVNDNEIIFCRLSATSVTINEPISRIGDYAFSCCRKLKSVTIPSSVVDLGEYIFNGCDLLRNIYTDESNLRHLRELMLNRGYHRFVKLIKVIPESKSRRKLKESLDKDRLILKGLVKKYGKEDIINATKKL